MAKKRTTKAERIKVIVKELKGTVSNRDYWTLKLKGSPTI